MLNNYYFYINGRSVNPHYKPSTSKDFNLESGQMFFREELNGDLIFVKKDFDFLNSYDIETEFNLVVSYRNEDTFYEEYHKSVFYRTDGKWDEDNKTVTIKVNIKDRYTEILAKYENEYDLIKLGVAKTPLVINKRPLLQIYELGSNFLTAYIGNTYWEADVANILTTHQEMVDMHFGNLSSSYNCKMRDASLEEVNLDYVGNYFQGATAGSYEYYIQQGSFYKSFTLTPSHQLSQGSLWRDTNNNLWMVMAIPGNHILAAFYHNVDLPTNGTLYHVIGSTLTSNATYTGRNLYSNYNWYEIRNSNGDVLYATTESVSAINSKLNNGQTIYFNGVVVTNRASMLINVVKFYGRYILDSDTIDIYTNNIPSTFNTFLIPSDDISGDNRNYHRCYPVSGMVILQTGVRSVSFTQYGLMDNGYYFDLYANEKYVPLARSTWDRSSSWIKLASINADTEISGRKEYTMKDTSLISDVISRLLLEIDPTITHEATTQYSEFLYGTNPISSTDFRLMLTQKSNILAGEYDRAAQKAPIKFRSLMDMIKNTMQLYWHIDSSNRLRIEHISWYKNGGSYSGTPSIYIDLTNVYAKNGKLLTFGTNNFEYEKQELSERIEFKWMDDVSNAFIGYPIEVLSKFIQRGKVDTISISEFTSDVDYMLTSGTELNMDGFAVFAAVEENNIFKTAFVTMTVGIETFIMQNGYLSFIYLHDKFWRNDLPANRVKINTTEIEATGIKRTKKQVVKFQDEGDPDPLMLIKTALGDGQIDKLSINLSSRTVEATLKYDTE